MLITLDGIPPSKKNSKRIVRLRNGRTVLLSSEAYLTWESNAVMRSKKFAAVQASEEAPYDLTILVLCADKRKRDADNIASSVMDMLVKAGIIEDDNLGIIPSLSVRTKRHQVNQTNILLTSIKQE